MIDLTEKAADRLSYLLSHRGDVGLRVGVRGGGCSGFSYFLEFDEKSSEDKVLEVKGVNIYVDRKSFLYLAGTTIDYSDDLNQSGFSFSNPNAKRTCGCGESFST